MPDLEHERIVLESLLEASAGEKCRLGS
jgi:hypothetical protein